MGTHQYGLIDNWLRTIKDAQNYYWQQLEYLDEEKRFDRLVELNVIEQVYNLAKRILYRMHGSKGKNLIYMNGYMT